MENDPGSRAVEHFAGGWNCAESVLLAVSAHLGISDGTIPKAASGFGGGMGRCGRACGAFTGAVLAMGLKLGRSKPTDERDPVYAAVRDLERRFLGKFGAMDCRDLTGFDLRTHEGHAAARAAGVFEKKCREYVRFTADAAVEIPDEPEWTAFAEAVRSRAMLKIADTVLVLIDVQGRLAEAMHEKEALFAALQKLVRGLQVLQVPILWLEQNPERMGATIPELRERLAPLTPIPKLTFSACGEPVFLAKLEALGRKQVLLSGIETHVCIHQTAADLAARGYGVEVVADAVSSRTPADRQIGLDRLRASGARLTSVEMCLFELLETAAHPAFKEILKIVK